MYKGEEFEVQQLHIVEKLERAHEELAKQWQELETERQKANEEQEEQRRQIQRFAEEQAEVQAGLRVQLESEAQKRYEWETQQQEFLQKQQEQLEDQWEKEQERRKMQWQKEQDEEFLKLQERFHQLQQQFQENLNAAVHPQQVQQAALPALPSSCQVHEPRIVEKLERAHEELAKQWQELETERQKANEEQEEQRRQIQQFAEEQAEVQAGLRARLESEAQKRYEWETQQQEILQKQQEQLEDQWEKDQERRKMQWQKEQDEEFLKLQERFHQLQQQFQEKLNAAVHPQQVQQAALPALPSPGHDFTQKIECERPMEADHNYSNDTCIEERGCQTLSREPLPAESAEEHMQAALIGTREEGEATTVTLQRVEPGKAAASAQSEALAFEKPSEPKVKPSPSMELTEVTSSQCNGNRQAQTPQSHFLNMEMKTGKHAMATEANAIYQDSRVHALTGIIFCCSRSFLYSFMNFREFNILNWCQRSWGSARQRWGISASLWLGRSLQEMGMAQRQGSQKNPLKKDKCTESVVPRVYVFEPYPSCDMFSFPNSTDLDLPWATVGLDVVLQLVRHCMVGGSGALTFLRLATLLSKRQRMYLLFFAPKELVFSESCCYSLL